MTLPELRSCLDRLGVKLSLRLVVDAPAGVMTPEIKAALAVYKPRLAATLAAVDDRTDPDRPPVPDPFRPGGPADDYDREERAAILEYDAHMTRAEAERRAGLRPVDT